MLDLATLPARRTDDASVDAIDAFLMERRPETMPYPSQAIPLVAELLRELGVDLDGLPFPTVAVVGSKGKGTTTAAASAALAHSGLVVGTVTSPHLMEVRERIRIDGIPLDRGTYVAAGQQVRDLVEAYAAAHPGAPLPYVGGRAFMVAMVAFARAGVDVAVVEASMGGRSDVCRLLPSPVVAVTQIFDQHLGVLGRDIPEIAVEKLGVLSPSAVTVVTPPQRPAVSEVIAAATGDDVRVASVQTWPGWHPNPLMSMNMEVGRRAAEELLTLLTGANPGCVLPPMRVPGRGQRVGRGGMVDTAVTGHGVAEAIRHYQHVYGRVPDRVVGHVSSESPKDAPAVAAAIRATGATAVGIDRPTSNPFLRLNTAVWDQVVALDDVDHHLLGDSWLLVGTVPAAVAVLRRLGADTARLW